ncbi:MAG: response regulator [Rhizobiaceae bacterium]
MNRSPPNDNSDPNEFGPIAITQSASTIPLSAMSFLNDRIMAVLQESVPASTRRTCVAAQPLAGFKILILEDEYLIAMDVEQLCRDHGAEGAILVHDLDDVEQATAEQHFDVAVIDLVLNGRSTLDFARKLLQRNVPFVFATGYDGGESRFAEFSGIPVVGKPYSAETLINAIADAVGRSDTQATLEPNT